MVKEARELVRRGDLGRYPQDRRGISAGLAARPDRSVRPQAGKLAHRPEAQAGAAGCIGDIGTHAENLGRYITGLDIESLCADFTTFVKGRALEDDGNILVRYEGGAKGILYASQISTGDENNLNIRIYGTKGSLAWKQEHPNELFFQPKDQPARILRRGNGYLSEVCEEVHPPACRASRGFHRGLRQCLRRSRARDPRPAQR